LVFEKRGLPVLDKITAEGEIFACGSQNVTVVLLPGDMPIDR